MASTIANVNRKSSAKPLTPADFMPKFEKQDKDPMTPEQIHQVFAAIVESQEAAKKEKEKGKKKKTEGNNLKKEKQ